MFNKMKIGRVSFAFHKMQLSIIKTNCMKERYLVACNLYDYANFVWSGVEKPKLYAVNNLSDHSWGKKSHE